LNLVTSIWRHICIDLVIFTAFPSIQLLPILKFWQICITVLWFNMFLENIHFHIGFYLGTKQWHSMSRHFISTQYASTKQWHSMSRHFISTQYASTKQWQYGKAFYFHSVHQQNKLLLQMYVALMFWFGCIKSGSKMPWHTVIVLLMHTEWK
jgi:hypothetical protein